MFLGSIRKADLSEGSERMVEGQRRKVQAFQSEAGCALSLSCIESSELCETT